MKHKSGKSAKRFTAWITLLAMIISMVPTAAFADTTPSQIVYSGLETAKTPAPPTSTTEVSADGKVTFKKTVSEVEGQENVFDINLEVTTKEDIKNQQIVEDTAVLLIVDTSISMAWRIDSTTWNENSAVNQNIPANQSRIYAAKQAIYAFIENYVADSGDAERYLGLVTFGDNAYTKSDFVDLNAGNNRATFVNTVSKLYGDRGTDAEAGFLLGRNLIKKFKDNHPEIENVHVIFLSDGNPTFGINDSQITSQINKTDSITHTVYNRDKKSGTDYIVQGVYDNLDGREGSISIPQLIKDMGGVIYSVAFALSHKDAILDYKDGDKNQPVYIADVLASISSNGSAGVFEASDLPQLVTNFEEISKAVSVKAEAWQVTDPLPENIVFDTQENTENRDFSIADKNHYKYFDKAKNTITWDVRSDKNTVVEDKENGTFTYTMNYRIILDNTSTDFAYNTGIETNETTSLTYLVTEKSGETTKNYTNGTLKLVASDEQTGEVVKEIPQVQGFKGDLSFTKLGMVNGEAVPLAGATFTLTSTTKIPGTTNSVVRTAISDADGVVTFDRIPSGYAYTLAETAAPYGYEKSDKIYHVDVKMGVVIVEGNEEIEFTNYKKQVFKDIDVIKNWVLYTGGEGFPLEFTLKAFDGETQVGEAMSITLSSANAVEGTNGTQWKGTFADVPTIHTETGRDLSYVVSETYANSQDADKFANDFTTSLPTVNVDGSYTFTNTQINPTTVTVDVTKQWVTAEGVTLPTVKVTLLQDGEEYKNADGSMVTADLTEANSWTAKFENLPYYNERTKEVAVYSVSETFDDTNFAQKNISEIVDGTITVTNTLKQVEKTVSGEKIWNYDSRYVTLPDEITVKLFADGEYVDETTVTAENNWKYEFKGLDTFRFNGDSVDWIKYTVEEIVDNAELYTTVVTDSTITNTVTETVDIPVTKVWNGIGANYGAVTITLSGNGESYTAELIDSYTFTDLNKYDANGQLIDYTLTEQAPDAYAYEVERVISETGDTSFVLTNTLQEEGKTTINVTKIWKDPQGTVHNNVSVELQSRVKGSSDPWEPVNVAPLTLTFGDDGTESQSTGFFVVDGYKLVTKTQEKPQVQGGADVKQALDPDLDMTEDQVTQGDTTEDQVTQGDLAESDIPSTDSSENSPSDNDIADVVTNEVVEAYFSALDGAFGELGAQDIVMDQLQDAASVVEMQEAVELEFMVVETNIPENYRVDVVAESTNNFVITNTIKGTVSYSGTKTWVAPAGTTLPNVTIQLFLNDTDVVDTTVLANGDTTYSLTADKYDSNGQIINYTVKEQAVAGYTATYERLDNNITNITNTMEMTYTPINVTKVWIDPDGVEHQSVEIEILRNGESFTTEEDVATTVVVGPVEGKSLATDKQFSVSVGGERTFPDYNKDFTVKYDYTLKELTAVEGYEAPINDGFVVTNKSKQEYTTVSGVKIWNAPATMEKPEITINLLQNDKFFKHTTLANGVVEYEFKELPIYDEARVPYQYTVEEVAVEGYTTSYMDKNIINTINQEQFTVEISKVWKNAEGRELPNVDFQLYKMAIVDNSTEEEVIARTTQELIETITLSEATQWKGAFKQVDKYDENGQYITYVVKESTKINSCLQMEDQMINALNADENNQLQIEAVNTYITTQYRVILDYITRTNGVVTETETIELDPIIVDLGTSIVVDEDFVREYILHKGEQYSFLADISSTGITIEKDGEDYVINLVFNRDVIRDDGAGPLVPTDPTPDPTPEVDITDGDTPLATVTAEEPVDEFNIDDDGVPLDGRFGEEDLDILDDAVPLSDIPRTADYANNILFGLLAMMSAAGLAVLAFAPRRKEEN